MPYSFKAFFHKISFPAAEAFPNKIQEAAPPSNL